MKEKSKKVLLSCMLVLGCALCSFLLGQTFSYAAAIGVNVQYHTQEEITQFIKNSGAEIDDELSFATKPTLTAPYAPGSLSPSTKESAINMLNQIRYIAGISYNVQLSDTLNEKAQAAALVSYANGYSDHYPKKPAGMENSLYELGYKGASTSNLAGIDIPSLNTAQVLGWMADEGESNIDRVGHRRWLLDTTLIKIGFGSVSGPKSTFSAACVVHDEGSYPAEEYGVMWPAQNMPVTYFDASYPWSISMGENIDKSSVKVKLTRKKDGKEWNFSESASDGYFNVDNQNYGHAKCVIFRPDSIKAYEAGDKYDVVITGLPTGRVSYSVNFFDYHKYKDVITPATFDDYGRIISQCVDCGWIAEEDDITWLDEVTLLKEKYVYDGKMHKPSVKVRDGDGKIVDKKYYTVTYPSGCKNPGEYKVKIKFKEHYAGMKTKTFTVKPKTVASVKAKKGKKQMTVSWKKDSKATGYQVTYAQNKAFTKGKKNVTISKNKTVKTTVKKLKPKKTYYVKVRAYKKAGNAKIYGAYSSVKTAKVK